MTSHTGVGYSTQTDSFLAGVESARRALDRAGTDRCDLAFAFVGGKHDARSFHAGVRSILPAAALAGGSAVGVIGETELGYTGLESGVAVIASDRIRLATVSEQRLDAGEQEHGDRLGRRLAERASDDDRALMLFYDSSRSSDPPLMNMATPLLTGLLPHVDPRLSLAGCGLMGDIQLRATSVFCDDEVLHQSSVVVRMSGACRLDTVVIHGCRPASSYRRITRAESNVVFEIDGRPALDVIDEMLGADRRDWSEYPLFVTLGVNRGPRYAEFRSENYANRLTMAVDPEHRALVMFEPDLVTGAEVQLMRRSVDLQYIATAAEAALAGLGGRRPLLALYINCIGRAMPFTGSALEDAAELQRVLRGRVPLLGVYSGVELAPVGDVRLQPLDWTGVLCLISEEP